MRGVGIKRAVMRPRPRGWLLDLSRLVSRIGGGPLTGIDRVERAWLRHLLDGPDPVFFLCRGRIGQMILSPAGGRALAGWIEGHDPATPATPAEARARLRSFAVAWSGRGGGPFGHLGRSVRRLFPGGGWFLSLGHTNLRHDLMAALAAGGLRRAVMIHDVIPLDFPQFSTAQAPARFAARFAAACDADCIIATSHATARDIRAAATARGLTLPEVVVAHLGTELPPVGDCPAALKGRDWYVTLGTVEPRKNHALLLDVWARLPAPRPLLAVVGRRGWAADSLYDRLEQAPDVIWFQGLNDPQTAAVLAGARGLLMPSYAEGFGMPLTEAAARGVPVISSPLPVAKELLGEYARYAKPDDVAGWVEAVQTVPAPGQGIDVPSWAAHFVAVKQKLAQAG